MIWGWVISSGFICFIGLAMSDLASSMPTSGGQSLPSLCCLVDELTLCTPHSLEGLYYWTHALAPASCRGFLSWIVACESSTWLLVPFLVSQCLTVDLSDNSFLGNVAATCSLAWACSGIFFAGATLQNEDFSPTTGATFGLFIGILALCGLLCAYGTNVLARLQTPSVILNVVISVATIIGLPIARRGSLNSGAYSASMSLALNRFYSAH